MPEAFIEIFPGAETKVWVVAPFGVTCIRWIDPAHIVATSGVRQLQEVTVTVCEAQGPAAGAQPPSPRA